MNKTLKILIVEDDFTSRIMLQEVMNRYGVCHAAANGVEAVVAFQDALQNNEPYHLVLLDIMLPEMDGQETLKRIRAIEDEAGIMLGKGAKIIMVTGKSDSRNIIESFNETCDAYLIKPIHVEKLNRELINLRLIP